MIKLIPDLPDNVLGFEATETVTGHDYETVLVPAVEAKLEEFSKVRLLCHLGPDFSGYDLGAMWDDTKIGLKYLKSWERIAVVSDDERVRSAIHIFGFTMPGHVRLFKNTELLIAREWLSE